MENSLISVIVPIYNTKAYLHRSIESIIAQTHQNLEIILINDGSTDGSGEICNDFAQKDNRVKVIHQENAGVSAARNVGLDIAQGAWIGFVDSDDWIESEMYERLLQSAIENEKQIAVCGFIKHHIDGQTEIRTFNDLPDSFPSDVALEHVVSGHYYEGFMVNKLFCNSLFEVGNTLRFEQEFHFCEDLVLVVQLLLNTTEELAYVPESLYHYCTRRNSTTSTFNVKRLSEISARKRVIELTEPMALTKVRYVQAIVGILYHAGQCGKSEYFSMLRNEARRYTRLYFSSSEISLKMKFRSVVIFLNPRLAYMLWDGMKRTFRFTWWGKEINR